MASEQAFEMIDKLFDSLAEARFNEMFGDIKAMIKLGEATDILGGFAFNSGDIDQNGIRLVQISNVNQRDIDWTVSNCVPLLFEKKHHNFMLNEFDIVVALTRPIIQSQSTVKVSIVRKEDLPCILNQRLGRIRCDHNMMNHVFVYYCLKQPRFTRYIGECCTGSSQPNLSIKDLISFKIPFAHIQKQNEFASFIDQANLLKKSCKQIISKLDVMVKSRFIEMFGHQDQNEKGFKRSTIGESCIIRDSERIPVTTADREPGPYPYYGANGLQDYVKDYIFDGEFVLMAEDGGYFDDPDRPIAYSVSGKCWVNNHAHILQPGKEMNVHYLEWALKYRDITNVINGTTRSKLTQAAMRSITILLPPLDLQESFSQFLIQVDKSKSVLIDSIIRLLSSKKEVC